MCNVSNDINYWPAIHNTAFLVIFMDPCERGLFWQHCHLYANKTKQIKQTKTLPVFNTSLSCKRTLYCRTHGYIWDFSIYTFLVVSSSHFQFWLDANLPFMEDRYTSMIQTRLVITGWSTECLKKQNNENPLFIWWTKETPCALISNRRSRQSEPYLTAASILTGRPYLNFITILLYNTIKRIKCIRLKDKYKKVGERRVGYTYLLSLVHFPQLVSAFLKPVWVMERSSVVEWRKAHLDYKDH